MSRVVNESPVFMGPDEEIAWGFEMAKWGTPTSPSAKLYDLEASNADVSATCLSGSASAAGTVVTTPIVKDLTAGGKYRLVVTATFSGNVESAYMDIYCQEV